MLRRVAEQMRILKNKLFTKFARKAGLDDRTLCEAIANAERGLIEADLGGGVIKQRIARPGKGKSCGFRTMMILYKRATRAVFVYGLAKRETANIARDELATLKELASQILAYDDRALAQAAAFGTLIEVICHEKN